MSIGFIGVMTAAVLYLGIKKFWDKKVFIALLLASCACLLFALFYEFFSEAPEIRSIARNSPGQGDEEVDLSVVAGGEKLDLTLKIPQMELSEAEAELLIRSARTRVNSIFPEDRKVSRDLGLPTCYEDLGVSVRWYSSDNSVINSSGRIERRTASEGKAVTLKALFKAGRYEEEAQYELTVYPPSDLSVSEKILYDAEELNKGSDGSRFVLPDEVDGMELSWYRPKEDRALAAAIIVFLAGLFIHIRTRESAKEAEAKRAAALKHEYPEFVSRLLMFMYAGLSCRSSFQRIASMYTKEKEKDPSYKSVSGEEAILACSQMDRGVSESEAYARMGERSRQPQYKVLAMLLERNLKHGNAGLVQRLEQETYQAYEERKREAKAEGEKVSIRLIIPMGMMLVTVLIILVFPAMMSVG